MDRPGDERIETGDPRDDPPKPTPQIETDVEIGGGDVLIPDDDDEVKPDDTVEMRRAARSHADIGRRSFMQSNSISANPQFGFPDAVVLKA